MSTESDLEEASLLSGLNIMELQTWLKEVKDNLDRNMLTKLLPASEQRKLGVEFTRGSEKLRPFLDYIVKHPEFVERVEDASELHSRFLSDLGTLLMVAKNLANNQSNQFRPLSVTQDELGRADQPLTKNSIRKVRPLVLKTLANRLAQGFLLRGGEIRLTREDNHFQKTNFVLFVELALRIMSLESSEVDVDRLCRAAQDERAAWSKSI